MTFDVLGNGSSAFVDLTSTNITAFTQGAYGTDTDNGDTNDNEIRGGEGDDGIGERRTRVAVRSPMVRPCWMQRRRAVEHSACGPK